MVCDLLKQYEELKKQGVLILILLEYGLRLKIPVSIDVKNSVLILILLEYGLRRVETGTRNKMHNVLILILLEYGLRRMGQVLLG